MVYQHPERFPKNVEGPFYTLGAVASCGNWSGECLSCEAPELEAPELLALLGDGNSDTYFVRQPKNDVEIERACRALEVCCVYALRYAGTDPAIIRRLGNKAEYCDHVLIFGRLVFIGESRPLNWLQRLCLWVRSFWSNKLGSRPSYQ